jgi:integrase
MENKDLLDDFVSYKRSSDKSPQTIHQYYQMIRLFFCWNYSNNNNKSFIFLKKRDLVRFFSQAVEEWQWSPNRIHTVKSALSSLSNYIENILDDEYPDFRNIVQKIEVSVKQPVREKTVLTQEQIDECLKTLVFRKKYQTACYLALAVASGARKSELLRFKVDYFKDENIKFGCLYKTPEQIKTKGRSSKGKMLYKYVFKNDFKPYFDLWMEDRKKKGIESEWLFVVKNGNEYVQAKTGSADNWCKEISNIIGVTFYSHSARHALCTKLRAANLPDKIIQEFFGWSSLELINIYDDSSRDADFGKYFTEDGIAEIEQTTVNDI